MDLIRLKTNIIAKLKDGLSEKLTYHCVEHTLAVLECCNLYIKRLNIGEKDARLLRTAALFHDTGFMSGYDEHEELGIVYARKILPDWGYSSEEIETIAGIIRATKIPQQPHTLLEEIIGDSDLDYLGTDKFYEIGELLYKELVAMGKIQTREQWNQLQIGFLQKHRYHTDFAQKHREPVKQKHLEELIKNKE